MALLADGMTAVMLGRAVAGGLIDQPPDFNLTKTLRLIATGVVDTFLEELDAFGTVTYGPGQPAIPIGAIVPVVGMDGLDPERFWPVVHALTGFVGPFSVPFFSALGGIIEYLQANITIFGLSPTATATALLPAGGIFFNPDGCFDRMHSEAISEEIMVVRLGVHTTTPTIPFPDPVTALPLFVDDLFSQAEILLRAVANGLVTELVNGTKSGIPVAGPFNPLDPPVTVVAPLGRFL